MTTLYDIIEKLRDARHALEDTDPSLHAAIRDTGAADVLADACATLDHLAEAYDDLRDAAAALLARTQPGYDYELEQLRAAMARVDSE